MHLLNRSPHISINSCPTSTLPPELWELVCSFLPKKEVCRLRSLNSCFLSAALAIHYGTLYLTTDDRKFRFSLTAMKFTFDVMTGKRQYMLDNVHTLSLENTVANTPFYSSITWSFLVRDRDDFHNHIAFATRFPRRLVARQLRCLRNIQTLYLKGRPFPSKAFGTIFFRSISRTLVHVDLGLVHFEFIDLSGVGGTVLCPNVRSLGLSMEQPDDPINLPLTTFLEESIQRIRLLVPSNIESLELRAQNTPDLSSYLISLSFFTKLKKLGCTSNFDSSSTALPIDITELINTNVETLVDIQLDLIALPATKYYEEFSWSDQIHTLSLSALAFYQKRHIYLPQLEKCQNLRKLQLEGNLSNLNTVDLEAFHQSLLMVFPQLIHLAIPFRTLSFRRIWNIVCTFPNLDTVVFRGVADSQDLETRNLLIRTSRFIPSQGYAASPHICFYCLRTVFGEIRKSMGERSSSDLWREHAIAIENAFSSNSLSVH